MGLPGKMTAKIPLPSYGIPDVPRLTRSTSQENPAFSPESPDAGPHVCYEVTLLIPGDWRSCGNVSSQGKPLHTPRRQL